jgi:cyclopropane-fatty-acyl-phospholipid synthase
MRPTVARAAVRRLLGAAICAHITVHDPRFYARVLREGSVGLGESYADGWWDAEDLAGVLRLMHRRVARTHSLRDRAYQLAGPARDRVARGRGPDRAADVRNVRAHYDLGNELFQCLLDDTMMYSCAVFESPGDSLATASIAKLDRLARILELGPDDHVLEIGTGWGGFSVYAARQYGCRVTTTTISKDQYEYARTRVHDAGLDHLVTVRADDYRDIRGRFDKVIAIEMIEAVDWREYDTFFGQCRNLLADDGILALQAIVVPDRSFDRTKHTTDFIKAAIFPGGCLPSVEVLTTTAKRAGLPLAHIDDIGVHYAETLRRWRANLTRRREELRGSGYDDRFARLWEFYFSYCEAGFDERYVSAVQIAFASPNRISRAPRVLERERSSV